MLRKLILWWFKKSGWKFVGPIPKHLKKIIIVAGPHTSRRDLLLGLAVSSGSKFRTQFLVDEKYVNFATQKILAKHKIHPYSRTDKKKNVQDIISRYSERKKFSIVICPEIYYKKNDSWDASFYDIAMELDLPIMMVGLNYSKKIVQLHGHFLPTGDRKTEVDFVKKYFASFSGKHPKRGIRRF